MSEIEKAHNQQEIHNNGPAKPIRIRITIRPKWLPTLPVLQNQRVRFPKTPTATHAMETLDETPKPRTTNITQTFSMNL